jgi:hypothetical protein
LAWAAHDLSKKSRDVLAATTTTCSWAAPPTLVNSLHDARSHIQRIKAILRGFGVAVDDRPAEEVE